MGVALNNRSAPNLQSWHLLLRFEWLLTYPGKVLTQLFFAVMQILNNNIINNNKTSFPGCQDEYKQLVKMCVYIYIYTHISLCSL